MSLNIPEIKRTVFKQHTIKNCIIRLDYENLFDVSDSAKEAVKVLAENFPNRKKEFAMKIDIFGGAIEEKSNNNEYIYSFMNKGETNHIILTNTAIIMNFSAYINFDDISKHFQSIFNVVKKYYPDNTYKRLGVRKINWVSREETSELNNFKDVFNGYLTSSLDKGVLNSSLQEDAHKIVATENGNINVLLQYGTRKGIVNGKPHRLYILDIDCSTDIDINEKTILDNLARLNQRIFDIYSWSITDNFKKELMK